MRSCGSRHSSASSRTTPSPARSRRSTAAPSQCPSESALRSRERGAELVARETDDVVAIAGPPLHAAYDGVDGEEGGVGLLGDVDLPLAAVEALEGVPI